MGAGTSAGDAAQAQDDEASEAAAVREGATAEDVPEAEAPPRARARAGAASARPVPSAGGKGAGAKRAGEKGAAEETPGERTGDGPAGGSAQGPEGARANGARPGGRTAGEDAAPGEDFPGGEAARGARDGDDDGSGGDDDDGDDEGRSAATGEDDGPAEDAPFPEVTLDTALPEGGERAAPGDAPAPARQWPLLSVLGATALGLAIVGLHPFADAFRVGTILIGIALMGGAVLRRLVPSVGMLAVRSRFTDMVTYGLLGILIVLLALMTQPRPWLEIPFLEDVVHSTVP